jgi:hypothetical protein
VKDNIQRKLLIFQSEQRSSYEQSTFFVKVKESIQRETANISRKEVCQVSRHTFSRFNAYLGGQYLETLL